MKRRTFAAAASGTLAGLAGCLDQLGGGASTTVDDTTPPTDASDDATGTGSPDGDGLASDVDGYPENVAEKPADREVDTSGLDTTTTRGVEVPLLPVQDAYVWWAYRRARFADARGRAQWENSRIVGAVSSPADPDLRSDDDPTQEWGQSDRIVCYCGCPHHLSSIRASQLIDAGYENVYVIDEGFFEWRDRDYPVTSSSSNISRFTIRGRLDSRYAGEDAWVRALDSEQLESTAVAADGSFALHCKFVDVTADTQLRVETPAWSTTGTIRSLTDGVITADEGDAGPPSERERRLQARGR
jgi:rhodanese-related sulfurtransferase